MDASIIGGGAAFGAAALGLYAVQDYVSEKHRIYKGLRGVRSMDVLGENAGRKELSRPAGERLIAPALRKAGKMVKAFAPTSVLERLTQELLYAGSPAGWDAERVVAAKVLGVCVGFVGGLAAMKVTHLAAARGLIVVALLTVIGWYVPEWLLRSRSGRRQAEIRRTLPDALDLLSITVEAGLGFDAALDKVAKQAGGPLSEELNRVMREMQIGTSRSEALRGLSKRTTIEELRSFVLAMVQAEVFGISIARVLSVQAAEMRQKRRQRAEEKAQKVPVKIIFPVLFCIFPALFLVVIGPAVQNIYHALLHR